MPKKYIEKDYIKYIGIKDFFDIRYFENIETILVFEKLQDGKQSRIVRDITIIINLEYCLREMIDKLKDVDFVDIRYQLKNEDEPGDFKEYYLNIVEIDNKNDKCRINLIEV